MTDPPKNTHHNKKGKIDHDQRNSATPQTHRGSL
jgi:hypothetical protein